jgi:hypothetical protein
MILIGAALYLMGVVLLMEEISLQPCCLAFFVLAAVCHYVAILMAVASN